MEISDFQKNINSWGKINLHEYPWRYINDPYRILVSEFMLHRTQVLQVVPIYEKFIISFPNLSGLNESGIVLISDILHPLGLNWRIKGMVDALLRLKSNYGCIPLDYNSLISTRGIGPYIASATICFSTNLPMALIDTNTVRVIGRLFGLDISGESRKRKDVKNTISCVVDVHSPRDFYYSIIDFAHEICLPKKPLCSLCPFQKKCKFNETV